MWVQQCWNSSGVYFCGTKVVRAQLTRHWVRLTLYRRNFGEMRYRYIFTVATRPAAGKQNRKQRWETAEIGGAGFDIDSMRPFASRLKIETSHLSSKGVV